VPFLLLPFLLVAFFTIAFFTRCPFYRCPFYRLPNLPFPFLPWSFLPWLFLPFLPVTVCVCVWMGVLSFGRQTFGQQDVWETFWATPYLSCLSFYSVSNRRWHKSLVKSRCQLVESLQLTCIGNALWSKYTFVQKVTKANNKGSSAQRRSRLKYRTNKVKLS